MQLSCHQLCLILKTFVSFNIAGEYNRPINFEFHKKLKEDIQKQKFQKFTGDLIVLVAHNVTTIY